MKKISCLSLLLILAVFDTNAQKDNSFKGYRFTIDLINVKNDQIKVELTPPSIPGKSITYHLPKIVPGTYSEDDYGRYIEQFKAFDKKGDPLRVVKSDINSWTISNADKLAKLSYLVNDSFDDTLTKKAI